MSYEPRPNPSMSKKRGPPPGRGGRPHKRNSRQLLRVIRIDDEFYSFLKKERDSIRREHLGDTARRLIITAINKSQELEQENKQLKDKLDI
jgi:hypothetical protein